MSESLRDSEHIRKYIRDIPSNSIKNTMTGEISDMSAGELLNFAEKRIFSLGPRDIASVLAYENMRYGIGKMICALNDGSVHCVLGPDATITRNIDRWMSGFGYGAVIRWPDAGVFFPEMRPNGCGMILVRLEEMLQMEEIIERISEIEISNLSFKGIKLKPDFGKGNHFLEFYKTIGISPEIRNTMPEECNYAILHGSAPEKKDEIYKTGEGKEIQTPLGKISVLEGDSGREYYRKWIKYEEFCKDRREFLIKEVVGKCRVISNITHQGMFSRNEVRLGCYDTMDKSNGDTTLFPVALRWDHPVYIFKGNENLSDEVIDRLGFDERANDIGVRQDLKNINILPHGGGYKIELGYTKISVMKTGIGNNFILNGGKKGISKLGKMIMMNPHEIPYNYRGMGVIGKIMEYDLATPVAKLRPLMTMKI